MRRNERGRISTGQGSKQSAGQFARVEWDVAGKERRVRA